MDIWLVITMIFMILITSLLVGIATGWINIAAPYAVIP